MESVGSKPLFAPRSTEVNRRAEVNKIAEVYRSKQVNWKRSKLVKRSGKREFGSLC